VEQPAASVEVRDSSSRLFAHADVYSMQGVNLATLITRDRLRRLKVGKLHSLCQHFNLPVSFWTTKEPYIQLLWPQLQPLLATHSSSHHTPFPPFLPTLPSHEPSLDDQRMQEFVSTLTGMLQTMKQDQKQTKNPKLRRLRAQPGPPRGRPAKRRSSTSKGAV